MHVLITGGNGAIGSNLARGFLKDGHEVTVMDNLVRPGVEFNEAALKEMGAVCIRADARCPEDYSKLPTQQFDLIIECSAQPSATQGLQNPFFDFTNNTLAVMHVLEMARKHMAPIIFFSTNKIFAEICNSPLIEERKTRFVWKGHQRFPGFDSHCGFNEDLPTDGKEHSIYGASKIAAQHFIREYASAFGVPTITNAFSCMCSRYQYGTAHQGFLAWFVIANMLGKKIPYIGWGAEGKQCRDVLYADDVYELIKKQAVALIERPRSVSGNVYTIGGGMPFMRSLQELVSSIEDVTGFKTKIVKDTKTRHGDHIIYCSDTFKAQQDFRWKPKVSPEDAIVHIYEWVRQDYNILKILYGGSNVK